MGVIKESLTFDDVTLVPQYSSILPHETITKTELSKNLKLNIPLLSSAMDTVTESKMAIAIAKSGGLGIIHKNLNPKKQALEVKKVKKNNMIVGAAVGTNEKDIDRVYKLLESKVDLIVVDTAHGHTKKVLTMINKIKKISKNSIVCAGNVATGKAAKFLADSGADIVKVGIGPGSICTTRLVTGIGIPQLSAVLDSPGKIFKYKGKLYKNFRGMGSAGAMSAGSADRYFQKKSKNISKYVAEGVEGIIKFKGPVDKTIYQLVGGLKSSMGYMGSKTIKDLQKKSEFVKITKAGFYESMVHNVDQIKNNE